jgi:hypothetical protein
MQTTLEHFADAWQQKFSVRMKGEPEDWLRPPAGQLLIAIGRAIGLDVPTAAQGGVDL